MPVRQASVPLVMRFRIPASPTELLQQESEWHNALEESKYEIGDADVPGEAGPKFGGSRCADVDAVSDSQHDRCAAVLPPRT